MLLSDTISIVNKGKTPLKQIITDFSSSKESTFSRHLHYAGSRYSLVEKRHVVHKAIYGQGQNT